jgi:hypothetical protein
MCGLLFGWNADPREQVCVGQALAEQGTFISIARMLWAFNIEKAIGVDGREIPVDIFDYTYVSPYLPQSSS